jgi:hypothetical protein
MFSLEVLIAQVMRAMRAAIVIATPRDRSRLNPMSDDPEIGIISRQEPPKNNIPSVASERLAN